jgi:hypothetical protein
VTDVRVVSLEEDDFEVSSEIENGMIILNRSAKLCPISPPPPGLLFCVLTLGLNKLLFLQDGCSAASRVLYVFLASS